jgi:glutamine cyclotransferase
MASWIDVRRLQCLSVLVVLAAAVGTGESRQGSSPRPAKRYYYKVVNSYPHDTEAYLQGLVFHEGVLYESTGLYGKSTLRRVKLKTGKVLQMTSLAPDLFGEGLALVDNRLIQLTWQSRRGFVYDRDSLGLLREFTYETEGWGLTYDGTRLIMSDGSSVLTYLDPTSFEPVNRLAVTFEGRPLPRLNELEYVEGEIWANVWLTDLIVRIDPATGEVDSYIDLAGILQTEVPLGPDDVLNGIAYDQQGKRVFVSGKRWPRVFEIKTKKKPPKGSRHSRLSKSRA